ncbi:MAG TPA: Rpn family recombination-promoting nuclease/putative transposase [Gemmataceae bacterium]|jgi:predicted transposase/invertase (TIGR01784 family)|nr:Rpn family recombination-promoting nuclease/putative transposase [Gemmataceae bacterium]
MKRDPLFFELFKELPGCFFQLIGRPESDAQRFELEAIEYKATSVRLDGVFRPREATIDPVYLWEVQYYSSNKVYANLLTKIGHFLDHGDPAQDWVAVVIYPSRTTEQKNLHPYRSLIESDQLVRIYLDELPPARPDQYEFGILELIAAKPEAALSKAKALVPRVKAAQRPKHFERLLLQFIETVILYQFPQWSRNEVEKMLQVTDIRQTRVYQEALEEGREEGRVEGRVEVLEELAKKMIKLGRPVSEITQLTGLTTAQVRKLTKKK